MEKKSAEKSREKEKTEESYSYYSSDEFSEDEDKEAQREEQDRAKDRAKFRGARPDRGDSSDGRSSHNSPLKDRRMKPKELRRHIKAARESTAKKRQHGSAVESRKKTRLSCSEPSGAAVAGKKTRLSCSEPSGAAVVNDLEDDFYSRRGQHQNFCGILEFHVRTFRDRQKRKGDPNQRNCEMKFPLSTWMVSKGCEPDEIDKLIFHPSASNPHICVIFVDMADGEQSKAYRGWIF